MPGYSRIGGGGGDTDATVVDEALLSDAPEIELTLEDVGSVTESDFDVALDLNDDASVLELIEVTLSSTLDDDGNATDQMLVSLEIAPDVDTYLQQDDASSAFGTAASAIAKAPTAVVNDAHRAYFAWDLSKFIGFSSIDTGSMQFSVSHDAVADAPLFYEFYTHTSQPFTDSSTWSSTEPPPGALMGSSSITIPSGAASNVSTTGSNAAVLDAVEHSEWVYIRFLGNTNIGGDLTTFTITTVDAGGASVPALTISEMTQ